MRSIQVGRQNSQFESRWLPILWLAERIRGHRDARSKLCSERAEGPVGMTHALMAIPRAPGALSVMLTAALAAAGYGAN